MSGVDRNELSLDLAQTVAAIYEQAEYELTEAVARRVMRGIDEPGWYEAKLAEIQALRAETAKHIERMQKEGVTALEVAVEQGYSSGRSAAQRALEDEPLGAIKIGARTNVRAIRAIGRALAKESGEMFLGSHLSLLRSTEDNYRSIIGKAASISASGAITRREATRRALYEFTERGIAQFVDRSGRKWGMQEYAEMATRTAVTRAYVQGTVDRFRDDGRDLVIVSNSPEECDLCRPYEGKILSLSGAHYDSPARRVLPPKADPEPTVEEVAAAPKPSKATKPAKPTDEEKYNVTSENLWAAEAELNQVNFERDARRKVLYDRVGGYYDSDVEDNDPEFSRLSADRERLQNEVIKLRKQRDKIQKTILPEKVRGKDFEKLELAERINKLQLEARYAGNDADRTQELIFKLRDQGISGGKEFREIRYRYELSLAKSRNATALADKLQKSVTEADAEVRPKAEPGSWADKLLKKIKTANTEEDIRKIGASVRNEMKKRTFDELGLKKPQGYLTQRIEMRDLLARTLREVRHMGTGTGANGGRLKHDYTSDSDSETKELLEGVLPFLPHAWLKRSVARGKIVTKKVSRGYHLDKDDGSPVEIMISGGGIDSMRGTAIHEWGHRMERTNARLLQLQKEFYERRTAGEKLEKMKDITGNQAYDDWEVARRDQFQSAYMGKDYGGRAYELLTMGLERAYFFDHVPDVWDKDTDFIDFILGLLAAG